MPLKKVPPSVSPGIPKSVAATISADPNKDLQMLISTTISNALQPLISKIDNLEKSIGSFQQQISEVEKTSQECQHELEQSKQQISRNETKIRVHAKKFELHEKQLIVLQTEKAKTALRLQNLPETAGDAGDLRDQISTLLAPLVKSSKETFNSQIEAVFRVFSAYTKNNNLPREVHIRFTSKNLRDEVLKKSNESPLTIGDKKLNILKDVPFLARQKRKKYKVLARLLIENKIKYIWCTIEGILFRYKDLTFRITSEAKLREFLKKYGSELGYKKSSTTDVEATEKGESSEEEGEETQGATGLAEITKQLKRYSFRERDK